MTPSPVSYTHLGVALPTHRPRQLVVEAGPAAAGVEFVLGTVERRTALATAVESLLVEIVIGAAEGSFGPLLHDHATLLGCQWFHILCIYRGRKGPGDS